MQDFYGTKRISARPMTRAEYNAYRNWTLPADEDGSDTGYLVEYHDGGQKNHANHEGYISWSPSAVFENAYQPVTALSFGHALQAMKDGHRVARSGWNGKGMFICILEGSVDSDVFADGVPHPTTIDGIKPEFFARGDSGTVTRLPMIGMRTATGSVLHGWLASQTDMLAEDWMVLPEDTQ